MIDHQERIKNLIRDHIKPHAMGVPFGFTISPVVAPMPDPNTGQPSGMLGPAWDLRMTVQTVPLLGQESEDIVGYMIIPGVMPPDKIFTMFAEKVMNDCLDERAKRMP